MKPSSKDYIASALLLLLPYMVTGSSDAQHHEHHDPGTSQPTPRNDPALCPVPGAGRLVLHPHPLNCSKYQQCQDGHLVDMDCPIGLHFNAALKTCDSPKDARCALKISEEIPDPVDPSVDGSQCPAPGEGDLVLLPDPKNCSQYLVCDNGQAIVMPCSPGLHFNPDTKVCELPSNAGCKQSASTHKKIFQRRVDGLLTKRIFGSCPPPGPGNLVLLPHPDDCSKYLMCDNGMLVTRPCPPNQHFNPNLLVCDFPWAAGCEKK